MGYFSTGRKGLPIRRSLRQRRQLRRRLRPPREVLQREPRTREEMGRQNERRRRRRRRRRSYIQLPRVTETPYLLSECGIHHHQQSNFRRFEFEGRKRRQRRRRREVLRGRGGGGGGGGVPLREGDQDHHGLPFPSTIQKQTNAHITTPPMLLSR